MPTSKNNFFFGLQSSNYNLIFSFITIFFYNFPFINEVYRFSNSLFFTFTTVFLVTTLMIIITNLLFVKKLVKPLSIILIIFNSISLYFMLTYKIVIDKIMLLNVIQTDVYEVADLMGMEIIGFFAVLCVVPAFIILKTNISFGPLKSDIKQKIIISSVLALVCSIFILTNPSGYKNLAQEYKYVKNYLIPLNYIGAIISVSKIKLKSKDYELRKISEDAQLVSQGSKPNLLVVIVGESARTANFSLFGYERETNKPLEEIKDELVLFKNFSSCGTSTAISLPCIFSPYTRENFNPESAKYTENVLDIFNAAGYKAIWRENNVDCKDNCNRIEIEKFCQTKECSDLILLKDFSQKVKKTDKPTIVVMHQRGSHGPMYSKRYPKDMEIYSPVCKDEYLDNCNTQELVNAYDNTIHYTSIVLKEVIMELKSLADDYNIALLFTSDHGESLGENGMYLHSAYYDAAPKEQTNVPTFLWFSEGYIKDNQLDLQCMKNLYNAELSHDNIFHTLIGMSGIKSSFYSPNLDMLLPCRKN